MADPITEVVVPVIASNGASYDVEDSAVLTSYRLESGAYEIRVEYAQEAELLLILAGPLAHVSSEQAARLFEGAVRLNGLYDLAKICFDAEQAELYFQMEIPLTHGAVDTASFESYLGHALCTVDIFGGTLNRLRWGDISFDEALERALVDHERSHDDPEDRPSRDAPRTPLERQIAEFLEDGGSDDR